MPLAPNDTARFLEEEKAAARSHILLMVPSAPATITYGQLWPLVLEGYVVTKPDVNRIAAALRKEGVLAFPDWEERKQVPDDHYRVSRTR